MAMQTCEGYVEDGKFYSLNTLQTRGRYRAFLTILDEPAPEISKEDKAFWVEFYQKSDDSADEDHIFDDEAFTRRPSGRAPIDFSKV